MDNDHITKTDKAWATTKQCAERASETARPEAEITAPASEVLEGKTTSLKIQKENGTIQEQRTYPRAVDATETKR